MNLLSRMFWKKNIEHSVSVGCVGHLGILSAHQIHQLVRGDFEHA